MSENEPVDVVFRVFRGDDGGVIALFPGLCGTNEPHTCSSYMHLGQHGSADPFAVVSASRPATPREYGPLRRELEAAPYHYRLRIKRRCTARHYQERKAALAAVR